MILLRNLFLCIHLRLDGKEGIPGVATVWGALVGGAEEEGLTLATTTTTSVEISCDGLIEPVDGVGGDDELIDWVDKPATADEGGEEDEGEEGEEAEEGVAGLEEGSVDVVVTGPLLVPSFGTDGDSEGDIVE